MLLNQIFTTFHFFLPQSYILDSSKSANVGMPFRSIQGTCMMMDIILEFHHFEISVMGVGSTSKGATETIVSLHLYFSCWDAGRICIDVSRHDVSRQTDGEKMGTVTNYFFGIQITVDGDCSHEIKRHLLLGRKTMTNLDSILKSRDITLPAKVCIQWFFQWSYRDVRVGP